MQRQLTLDLGTPPPSTFDNFHTGANAELVARLRELDAALAAGVDPKADRTFYVWGEPGNGRSHLLHALAYEAPPGHVRYLGPQSALAAFTFDARVTIYAVDDCDSLSGAQQIALFNLFNEVRSHPATALVATGNAPPMGLAVREDLRTRLGWGLVFHLAPLSDAGKAAVLKHAARERGINLADDVPAYLLTHFRRDMPSLMRLLDALDRFSLEQKRAVTLPLLRTMLAKGEGALSPEALAGGDETLFAMPPDVTDIIEEGTEADAPETPDAAQPSAQAPGGVELELFPLQDAPEHASSDPDYEAPKPPALQPRESLGEAPFQPPTDNVDGELGVRFRHVVHRELGTDLQGEVEADVSNEMSGELNGDLDPPAVPVDPSDPNAVTLPPAATQEPADTAPTQVQSDPSASPTEPDAAAPGDSDAPNTQPAPPAQAGSGNGFTRFK